MEKNNLSAKDIIKLIREKKSDFWDEQRKVKSLALFHKTAEQVPAYRDFLKKNKIDSKSIKNWEDFKNIPLVNKKNYLKKNAIEKLCWDGNLHKPLVFTSTSGSTGDPFYFPRGEKLDWQYSVLIEEFLENSLKKDDGPTLVVVCFGMGIWIGGLITYKAFEMASQRVENKISIITPGINKKEIFNVLINLSPYFKNTILIGYPPFIKDIIDEAPLAGIKLKKLNLKLIFAAEAFSEKFRDYLIENTNIKNPYLDTMNIYGTADIGAMAYETPQSILIRKLAIEKPDLFSDIFGSINKTPTLAQFNPLFVNFENTKAGIILTGENEIPLIRYGVGDHGGVYSYSELSTILKNHNIDLLSEMKKANILESANELPFVFVFERTDFSTTLYGLQIYPEIIRETMLEEKFNGFLSGKFTMMTKFDKKHNQYLEINIELKKNIVAVPAIVKTGLLKKILANLRQKNSEFRELSDYLKERANPKLVFWQHESPEFFKPGVKQKWVNNKR